MKRLTIIFLIGSLFPLYSCRDRVHCPAYSPDKVMYLPDKFAGSAMKYVSDDKTDSVLFQCGSLELTGDTYEPQGTMSCSAFASQELRNDESHIRLSNSAYKYTFPNAPTIYSLRVDISTFKINESISGYVDASEDIYELTEILPEWVSFNGRRYTNVMSCKDYYSKYKIYLAHGYGLVQIEMKEEDKIYYLE